MFCLFSKKSFSYKSALTGGLSAPSMTLKARVGMLPPWPWWMGLKPDSGSMAVGSNPMPSVVGSFNILLEEDWEGTMSEETTGVGRMVGDTVTKFF